MHVTWGADVIIRRRRDVAGGVTVKPKVVVERDAQRLQTITDGQLGASRVD